jgi:hypothetical protein
MTRVNPLHTGIALAATVGIGYAACAFLFWLWPEPAANYMNALFHGLDFRRLQSGSTMFNFGAFLYALVVSIIWAFGLGAIFGWVPNRVGGRQ